jgi:hypothetical protein
MEPMTMAVELKRPRDWTSLGAPGSDASGGGVLEESLFRVAASGWGNGFDIDP